MIDIYTVAKLFVIAVFAGGALLVFGGMNADEPAERHAAHSASEPESYPVTMQMRAYVVGVAVCRPAPQGIDI